MSAEAVASISPPGIRELQYGDLIEVFNNTFSESHNTCLQHGGAEPVYLPAGSGCSHHRIIFTHDYAASALHEIAHWLVAGKQRRLQEDYGYWYAPDGRNAEQQRAFEQVEVRPQAIEWLLSVAAGRRFRVSADNLEAGLGASETFKRNIYQQVLAFIAEGVSQRCLGLIQALQARSGVDDALSCRNYRLEDIE